MQNNIAIKMSALRKASWGKAVKGITHTFKSIYWQLSLEHRIIILNTVERIVKETLDSVDLNLASNLIKQASSELTQSKVTFIFSLLNFHVICLAQFFVK